MDGLKSAAVSDLRADFLRLDDVALPQVYGYLLRRWGSRDTAEELMSETFLAAVDTARRPLDVARLIGVARHKLADHWRAVAKEQRDLRAVATDPTVGHDEDDLPVPEVALLLERTVHATEALLVRACHEFRSAYTKSGSPAERRGSPTKGEGKT